MGTSKQSLLKLSAIIEQHSANQTDMPFRNMFATACYLSVIGEEQAARKQMKSLFDCGTCQPHMDRSLKS